MGSVQQVYIHLAKPEQIGNCAALDDKEHERAGAFRFDEDRKLYIAAHQFLRQTLSQYAPVAPKAWLFTTTEYGKPFITNPGYEYLQFNLSHTKGLIACAISHTNAVGVDVEKHKPLNDLRSLCRYALSPVEADDVLSIMNSREREKRFFTYWTLKEAYIKATGMGLSSPLQQFTLVQEQNARKGWWLRARPTSRAYYLEKAWRFETRILGQYHLAVSIKSVENQKTRFIYV